MCISVSEKSWVIDKGYWFKSHLDNLMLCVVSLDKELELDNGLYCPIHGESMTLIRLARQKMEISVGSLRQMAWRIYLL